MKFNQVRREEDMSQAALRDLHLPVARKIWPAAAILALLMSLLAGCLPPDDATQRQEVGTYCPAYPPHVCNPDDALANTTCTFLCQDEVGTGAQAYCPEITVGEDDNCNNSCSWIEPPDQPHHSSAYLFCLQQCYQAIQHKCIGGEPP